MAGLKGNIVYVIMFNYSNKDYSVTTIMSSIDSAFEYICREEKAMFDANKTYKLLRINNQDDMNFDYNDKVINICYVSLGDYSNLYTWDRLDISQFIIVPMKVH